MRGRALTAIAALFLAVATLGMAVSLMAVGAMRFTQAETRELVSSDTEVLMMAKSLGELSERIGRAGRTYVLARDAASKAELDASSAQFRALIAAMRGRVSGPVRDALARAAASESSYRDALDVLMRDPAAGSERIVRGIVTDLRPLRERLNADIDAVVGGQERSFAAARHETFAGIERSVRVLVAAAALSLLVSVGMGVALARTLSGLARSRREQEALTGQLAAANRDLDAFAGRVAHDLGNVLAPLSLIVSRLDTHADDPGVVRQCAQRMSRSMARAQRLITDLLAFARAGRVDPDARASLRVVMAEVLTDLDEPRRATGATVTVDVPDCEVACAPGLLHTVLLNVLGNAVKFLTGRPRREVHVDTRATAGTVEIVVDDTGPGVPEDERARIFRPFYRAAGALVPGTGLGLATVHRIVVAHGGSIDIDAAPEGGARFVVRLPAAPAPAEPSASDDDRPARVTGDQPAAAPS